MQLYDVVCPVCGKKNEKLLLEETNGSVECIRCKTVFTTSATKDGRGLPLLTKELCSIMAKYA